MQKGINPEDVHHGIEIRGVYDGICVWVMKDGSLVNRFTPEMGRRYDMTQEYIEGMLANSKAVND